MTLSLDDVKKMKVQVLFSASHSTFAIYELAIMCHRSYIPAQQHKEGIPNHQSLDQAVGHLSIAPCTVRNLRISIGTLDKERCSLQELRDELTKRGLDNSGLKAALAERLEENMKADADATAPNGASASTEPAQPAADLQAATNGSAVSIWPV